VDNKCRKANKLINGYIDDNLNSKDKDFFETHIKDCTECRESYDALKLLITDLSEAGLQTPPADFSSKLHMRLAEEAQKCDKRIFNIRPYINVAVSAALVCAVAFSANLYNNYSKQLQNDLITNSNVKPITAVETDETVEIVADMTHETDNTVTKKQAPITDNKENETVQNIAAVPKTADIAETTPETNTTEEVETSTVTEDYATVNEPVSTAISETSEAPSSSGGGGGGSSSAVMMRKKVFFAEYSVDLTSNPELIEQIKSDFNITPENNLICNEEEFNTLIEFLNNNDLFLDFIAERQNDNLITFKCTE